MKKIIRALFVSLSVLTMAPLYASHIEAGDLTFACIGPHQYQVTLTLYRDCHGITMPTSVQVQYSSVQCSTSGTATLNLPANFVPQDVTDTCPGSKSYCDGGTGFGVQKYSYTNIISLPSGCGTDWVISYDDCCRNTAITTINNPGATGLYIKATLNNTLSRCDNSPTFLKDPVAFACLNQLDQINQGGSDADGDSLAYQLIPSQSDATTNVAYSPGYSATTPLSVTGAFGFNAGTGQLTFTPNQTQVGVIKILVSEFRGGVLIGTVERDLQIVVQNCTDTLPVISNANGSSVVASTTVNIPACGSGCFNVTTSSPSQSSSVALTMTVTGLNNTPGATFVITPGQFPSAVFCWSPTRANAGTHNIFVTVKDNACPNPGQVTRTYTVLVPEVYPAGPDQTICQYNTVNAQASGTGTWSAMSTNPVATVIANTTSPTTLISGFTTAGRYNYIWVSDTICLDTMSIFVTSKPYAGPDQTVCQYGVATMAATGTGTWHALSTNPVTTVINDSILATTTVTGFTAIGTYTYVWTSNSCTDTVNITTSPVKPYAGPDQTVCSNTGTITMAATGTGTWTAAAANPGATTITTPISPTTTISGLLTAGTYTFYWGNGCLDTVLINVSTKPNGGPNQAICQYNSVKMGATGAGTWSPLSNNPATTIIASSSADSTLITGFTAAGTYNFIWSIGTGCVDTVSVAVTAKPNAGPDQNTCINNTATLVATGAGAWTILAGNPATTVIATPTSSTTSISGFTVAGTYSYIWTSGSCTDTANVIVNTKPNAGSDQSLCAPGTITTAAIGAGTWSIASGNPSPTAITTTGSAATTITGFSAGGTYTYIWTVNGCADSMNVTVTPVNSAGPDQTICQYNTVTTAAAGTGTWSILSTNPATTIITRLTAGTTTITGFTAAGTYGYVWSGNTCTDTMYIHVTVKPNAGLDQSACQFSTATLTGTGIGTWTALVTNPALTVIATPASPVTSISGFTIAGTYSYVWTANGCTDTANVVVTAKPNAGSDQTICQYTSTMLAATGNGIWTAVALNPAIVSFTNNALATTSVSGFTVSGTYTLIWTVNGCSDSVLINVTAKPNAGADQTTCQFSTVTLTAAGTGAWTALITNPAATVIATPASATTSVSGFTIARTYSYIWASNGCTDTTNVTVTAKPNAGSDQTICQYTSTTLAAIGNGTWMAVASNPAVVSFTNNALATTAVSGFAASGIYTLIWTVNGCSDSVLINVTAKPNAGADQTTCQFSTAILISTGIGAWTALPTNPAITVIAAPAFNTTSITGFTIAGTYSYVWTSNGCTDTANVLVTAKPNAGSDQTICQYTFTTLAAVGNGTWTGSLSNPAVVSFTNNALSTTSVLGFTAAGVYTLIWTVNGCSDSVLINVTAKPNAGADQTACQFSTATLTATGTGAWTALITNPAATVIATPASATTSISGFNIAGTYSYIWTSNGCTDTANVIVTAKPNAGSDQTICQYTSTTLAAVGNGTWTASLFNPAVVSFTNNALATTSVSGFTAAGTYTLIWTVNGCSDIVLISVTAKPNAGADQTTCQFSTAILTATGTGAWTALATDPATTVITTPASASTSVSGFTIAGTYSYIWTANGCTDTANVIVTAKPDAGPDVSFCLPGSTVITAASGPGAWTALSTNAPSNIVTPGSTNTVINGITSGGYYSYIWTVNGCTDSIVVTAYPTTPAGPDQSICQFNSIVTAAFGHGTWIPLATNPAIITIANTTADTTSMSGFNVAGTYSFIWLVSPCTDTLYVTVTAKPNAGSDQAICQYSSTVLAATGVGTWTADAGNAVVISFMNNNSPVSSVSGFTVAGTYTLYWSQNGCTDTLLINVTAKPNAGSDQTICQYTSTTLSATGNGTWSTDAGNPAIVTFVSNTDPFTTASGFSVAGTYTLYWSQNGCSDTVLINVTAKPDAGADQGLCLPGTITTAASAGAGSWTTLSTNPAGTIIAAPNNPATQISGFTTGGVYSYIWTVNGCTDTMGASIIPLSPAGADQTTCQYSTVTTAAFGNGTWTILSGNPAVTSLANTSSDSTVISGFSLAGTYGYIWTVNGCTDTMYVTVTAKPNAGSDQTICQYSSTALAATGTGTWTADAADPALVSFSSTADPAATVSGFTAAGTYTLYWSQNGCSDTVLINVTAKPNAGSDQTICQYARTALAATGTGTWTADAGNPAVISFVDNTAATTVVSGFTVAGSYTLYWSQNGCSDTLLISVTAKPNAGSDQTICQYATTALAATGVGSWSTDAGNPALISFTSTTDPATIASGFTAAGTYTLYWSQNGCSDTVLISVTAKPNAGSDQTICQYSNTVLAATGTGTWTADAGNPVTVSFVNNASATTTASGFATAGTYNLYWSANGCADTVVITVTAKPYAGADQAICQNSTATMAASGTGTWTASASNPAAVIFTDNTSLVTSVSGFSVAGTYIFFWSQGGCSDTMLITVSQASTISVNNSASCLGQNDTLTASVSVPGGSYSWSPGGATTPGIIVSPATTTTYTVTYSIAVCGTYTDSGVVTIYPTLTLTSQNDTICSGTSATLSTTPSTGGGTYLWTPGGFTNPSITVSPTDTTIYTVSYSLVGCPTLSVADTVDVTTAPALTVNNASVCLGDSATLTAVASQPGGVFNWQPGGAVTDSIRVAPALTSTYMVSYAIPLSVCPASTQTATVTVTAQPTVSVSDTAICQGHDGTLTATPSIAGGTYVWSPGGNSTPGITVSPATTSTYSVVYTIAGCGAATGAGVVTVNNNPVIDSISAQAISCYGYTNGRLTSAISPAGGVYTYAWSNRETGAVDTGLAAGSYTLVITDMNGCTAITTAAAVIPAAPADGIAEITPGDITVLQDSMIQLATSFSYPAAAITSYSWAPATGLSCIDCPDPIVNTTSAADTLISYTVTIMYNGGCSSMAADTIHILSGMAVGNAFTPNNDNVNDVFTIMVKGAKGYHMTIYNRWGEMVFETSDLTLGWDGNYKGSAEPQGEYMYFVAVTYLNGQTVNKTGTVTLLR